MTMSRRPRKGKSKILFMGMMLAAVLVLSGCGGKAKVTETVEETTVEETLAPTTMAEVQIQAADVPAPALAGAEAQVPGDGKEQEKESSAVNRIEAFAEQIQEAVADKDMEALAELLSYPCTIVTGDQESVMISDRDTLMKQNEDMIFGDDLMMAVANVDTAVLEKTETGYVMGDEGSNIRFQQFSYDTLGITEINE